MTFGYLHGPSRTANPIAHLVLGLIRHLGFRSQYVKGNSVYINLLPLSVTSLGGISFLASWPVGSSKSDQIAGGVFHREI